MGEKVIAWGDVMPAVDNAGPPYTWGHINGVAYDRWLLKRMRAKTHRAGWNVNMAANKRADLRKAWAEGKPAYCTKHGCELYLSRGSVEVRISADFYDCPMCWKEQERFFSRAREEWTRRRTLYVRDSTKHLEKIFGIKVLPRTAVIMCAALAYLAKKQADTDRRITTNAIAKATKNTRGQTYQALWNLSRIGYIHGVKGTDGGYLITEAGRNAIAS